MKKFHLRAKEAMMDWKRTLQKQENNNLPFDRGPTPFGGTSTLVLPSHLTAINLFAPFRDAIQEYFCSESVVYHDLVGHILSSQAYCLNLFGIGIENPNFVLPIIQRLPHVNNTDILNAKKVDFEWNDYEIVYHLFGEKTGRRGSKQTSCDLAVHYELNGNPCILLVEFKFTEGSKSIYHSLGSCFTADPKHSDKSKKGCRNRSAAWESSTECALECSHKKPQTYWSRLKQFNGGPFDATFLESTAACPFQFGGYQLMRSQLMGWLYWKRGVVSHYDFLLLYDARNEALSSPKPIAVGEEFLSLADWASVVKDNAFHHFTVQDLWTDLRPNDSHRQYIETRYLSWE